MMDNDANEASLRDQLAARLRQAEATIDDIRQGTEARFAGALQDALLQVGSAAQFAAPLKQDDLLRLIVGTAGQVLAARVAVLYLIDRSANELVLEVALGEPVEEARRRGTLPAEGSGSYRSPIGEGVVGWVALSGQPVAQSDLGSDPRFARATAERIGYIPSTTLCLPLRSADEVIGVIQLFDKGGGEPFTPADMQLLEQFGSAAAIAIEQSRLVHDLRGLFVGVLRGLLPDDAERAELRRALEAQGAAFAGRFGQGERYRDAIEITQLVAEISGYGPEGRQLARRVLESVALFLRDHSRGSTLGGGGL